MDVTEVFGITEVTTKDFLQDFRILSQKFRGVVWRQVTLKDRVQEMQKPYRATIASTCFSAGLQPGHSQQSPLWLKPWQGISTISLHDLLRFQKGVDRVEKACKSFNSLRLWSSYLTRNGLTRKDGVVLKMFSILPPLRMP